MKAATRKRGWSISAFANQSRFDANEKTANVEKIVLQANEINDNNNGIEKAKKVRTRKAVPDVSGAPTISPKNVSDWIEIFEPKQSEEVAVHPKKLTELQNWFMHCEAIRKEHPAQICLLTGPSGSGKTAAVRTLAKALKYELQEWINPVDRDIVNALGDQSNNYMGSQLDFFKSFLFRSSRYKSLFGPQNRLVLVEDFPNVILSNSENFETILDEYLKYGKSPLVFIVTDSKTRSLNISYNIFTEQLKNKFHINHIAFNPIAVTLMQKAMKRFCTLMKEPQISDTYNVPSQSVIDCIVFASQGDIRNALINLHFASLRGTGALPLERVETSENKGKTKKQSLTLKTIHRDESVTMMHALGRVFNPKRKVYKKTFISICLPNGTFVYTPEDISESFASEPKRFIDLMHANYLSHFSEIEHVMEAANTLSTTDNIINEYREESLASIALNIAVRSIMVTNEKPVSGWMPIRAANRYQIQSNKSQNYQYGLSMNLYATDYDSYVKIIKGSNSSQ